ncbi:MAG TPA: N-acetyl-gamma-glutamyl-phosphate reductase [Syntrophomonadaceae bacterium]|nr:N-acetyl-gamma-glutamyl-phosphate reductase [Syntrophomonadaceae bacterium]
MYRVGIVGDGYTAADLLRILSRHPHFETKYIFSTENIGREIAEVYPHLRGFSDLLCRESDWELLKKECDAVFLALPHGLSVPIVNELLPSGVKCVDLGADFRLKDVMTYEKYYELAHKAADLLEEAVYGIPELYRAEIKESRLVANPGCFPTGAILPLAPLFRAGLLQEEGLIVDAKTGVSGAGKTPRATSMFCAVNEGMQAYGVGTHRHKPEIAQELSFAAGGEVSLVFTPHLVPMNRGILTTTYSRRKPGVKVGQIRESIEEFYKGEKFIRILPEGVMPHTKWVYGSNYVDIGIHADDTSDNLVIVSVIDNLVKGASGQAIQNLNLMFGIEEDVGLDFAGVYP